MTAAVSSYLINSHTMYSTVLTTRGAGEPAIEERNRHKSSPAHAYALNCVYEVAG